MKWGGANSCCALRGETPISPLTLASQTNHLNPMENVEHTQQHNPLYPLTPQQVRELLQRLMEPKSS